MVPWQDRILITYALNTENSRQKQKKIIYFSFSVNRRTHTDKYFNRDLVTRSEGLADYNHYTTELADLCATLQANSYTKYMVEKQSREDILVTASLPYVKETISRTARILNKQNITSPYKTLYLLLRNSKTRIPLKWLGV